MFLTKFRKLKNTFLFERLLNIYITLEIVWRCSSRHSEIYIMRIKFIKQILRPIHIYTCTCTTYVLYIILSSDMRINEVILFRIIKHCNEGNLKRLCSKGWKGRLFLRMNELYERVWLIIRTPSNSSYLNPFPGSRLLVL